MSAWDAASIDQRSRTRGLMRNDAQRDAGTSGASTLQCACASLALLLLPCSALNFGISITIGDVFFIIAAFWNLRRMFVIRDFQICFLLAVPLVIVANIRDPNLDWIAVGQIVYIFGFVLPFGWCAFVDLAPARVATLLILSGAVNSLFALGQFWGLLPLLPSQVEFAYMNGELVRGSGLIGNTTALAEFLNPLAPLLIFMTPMVARSMAMACIVLGLLTTASKQIVVAIPALFSYWMLAGRKHGVKTFLILALCAAIACWAFPEPVEELRWKMHDIFEHRLNYTADSVDDRSRLIQTAAELLWERPLLGYGSYGAAEQMTTREEVVVHVHSLGLAISAGIPAALLLIGGMIYLVVCTVKLRKYEWTAYLVCAYLAMQFHPVMRETQQYIPIIVAGAAIAHERAAKTRSCP